MRSIKLACLFAVFCAAANGQFGSNATKLKSKPPCSSTVTVNCIPTVDGSGNYSPTISLTGSGAPGTPVNSVQMNCAGIFCGVPNFVASSSSGRMAWGGGVDPTYTLTVNDSAANGIFNLNWTAGNGAQGKTISINPSYYGTTGISTLSGVYVTSNWQPASGTGTSTHLLDYVSNSLDQSAAGSTGSLSAAYFAAYTKSGAGTISARADFHSEAFTVTAGTVTTYTGFDGVAPTSFSPGAITSSYGMRIPTHAAGTAANVGINLSGSTCSLVATNAWTPLCVNAGESAFGGNIHFYGSAHLTFADGTTQSTAATGGSSPTPVVQHWTTPWGTMTTGNGAVAALGAPNQVRYYAITVPYPGVVVSNVAMYISANPGHAAFAFYDATCTLIGSSATSTASGAASITFSALSVAAGPAYIAYTSDNTGFTPYAAVGDSGFAATLANQGSTSSTYAIFTGNASTGTTTLVFPSTCGTRTALSSGETVPGLDIH